MKSIKPLLFAACLMSFGTAHADTSFVITDYLHHSWHNELVNYEIAANKLPKNAQLLSPDGKPVPMQSSPATAGKVQVSFIVDSLPADGSVTYTLKKGAPIKGSLVKTETDSLVLDSGIVAARVPAPADRTYMTPMALDTATPPLLAVRGTTGNWIGQGRMAGTINVLSMKTRLIDSGPVYADVRTDYVLSDGTYSMNVRVVRGQDAVFVDEDYNTAKDANENAYFQFSVKKGLDPDRFIVKGDRSPVRPTQVDTDAGTDKPLDFSNDQREASVLGFVPWWPGTTAALSLRNTKGADTLTFLPCRIGQWRNPMGSYLETRKDGDVFLSLPLYIDQTWEGDGILQSSPYYTGKLEAGWPGAAGRRKWAFYLSTPDKLLPPQGLSSLAGAAVRYRDLPLDKIKDWTFDWPWQKVAYPRLYVKPGTAGPDNVAANNAFLHGPKSFPAGLRDQISSLLDGWGYIGYFAPNNAGPMGYLTSYDQAMGMPEATPDDKADMSRMVAFIAQMVSDDDWEPVHSGFHLGNPNMPPRQEHHLAVASAALPTHPMATQWRERGAAEQKRQMDDMVRPSGAWREGLHYEWDASMTPLLDAAVPLKLSGGYDVFTNPKFKMTWNYMVDALTPPSPRFTADGKADGRHLRVLPAFGHGSWEFMPLLGWVGAMTEDTDPEFSAHMM